MHAQAQARGARGRSVTWVLVNRITVDTPEEADQVVEAFRHRAGKVDLQPGFLGLEVWREQGGKEVVVSTRWQRTEDFEAWIRSPAFQHAHARASESPGTGHGTAYEIVI
jgi:heme-degrading monooxygenase HmoA